MKSQVKKCSTIALCALLILAVGCKKEDQNTPEQQQPSQEQQQPSQDQNKPSDPGQPSNPGQSTDPDQSQPAEGNVEDPHWKVTVENDPTTSMTVVVQVTVSEKEGSLAAFMGEACCEVATYDAASGLYWMYISPATEEGGEVQLRFYSPEHKHIYNAKSTFPYSNYGKLGTVAEPYMPEWVVSQ